MLNPDLSNDNSKPPIILDGIRYYYSGSTKHWYPSVTSVINWDSRKFFETWSKNPENAIKSSQALTRGNILHETVENYLLKKDLTAFQANPFQYKLFTNIKPYVDKITPVHIEHTLISNYLRIAGRTDCIGYYNNKLSIIDFKGSFKKKSLKYIENYFLQTTCYALMYEEMYSIPIHQLVVLVSCEDNISQEFIELPKNYYKKLIRKTRNFWYENNFESIQNKLNDTK